MSTPNISQQVLDKISAAFGAIADKLGVAATFLWHVFVRQAVVNGIECLVVAVALLVASIVAYRVGRCLHGAWVDAREPDGSYGSLDSRLCAALWLFAASAVSGILFVWALVSAIDLLANPGYWALLDLIDRIPK